MAFTPDNANMKHYPGTSKQSCEDGYEILDMPGDQGTQNDGRLFGRCLPTAPSEPAKDSD